ncbi:unnamed protein product [Heterotrigona itama]|uniref:Uncharacterized protein n=1 Tax=Heterotrigona itama TaxID=395501 RepID=A0A6V7HB79_9HYME|nr:unnamed protein product [Heterotrigona itama]
MLSAGTDGQDGPTDAAGAFGYPAIGPLIHDIYAKVNSITSRVIVKEGEKEEAVRKKEEEQEQLKIQQQLKDLCKAQELSGFLAEEEMSPNKSETDESDDTLPFILRTMEVERMLPENTLKENDTYNFYSRFKKGSDLFKTGFTGTNVMDLHFIYIKKRKCGCKIDFGKEAFENDLDMHDLHIDPSTIEKYKNLYKREPFDWHKFLLKPSVAVDEKADQLNIKITDDNLTDPCCRRDRKFPLTNLLKASSIKSHGWHGPPKNDGLRIPCSNTAFIAGHNVPLTKSVTASLTASSPAHHQDYPPDHLGLSLNRPNVYVYEFQPKRLLMIHLLLKMSKRKKVSNIIFENGKLNQISLELILVLSMSVWLMARLTRLIENEIIMLKKLPDILIQIWGLRE